MNHLSSITDNIISSIIFAMVGFAFGQAKRQQGSFEFETVESNRNFFTFVRLSLCAVAYLILYWIGLCVVGCVCVSLSGNTEGYVRVFYFFSLVFSLSIYIWSLKQVEYEPIGKLKFPGYLNSLSNAFLQGCFWSVLFWFLRP